MTSFRYQCTVLKKNDVVCKHEKIDPILINYVLPFKIHSIHQEPPESRKWGKEMFKNNIMIIGQPNNEIALFIFCKRYFELYKKNSKELLNLLEKEHLLLSRFANSITGIILYNRDVISRGEEGFGSSDNVKSKQIIIRSLEIESFIS